MKKTAKNITGITFASERQSFKIEVNKKLQSNVICTSVPKIIVLKLSTKLTENWFAKTGFSSHILGNIDQRRNSPLTLLPILPALISTFC